MQSVASASAQLAGKPTGQKVVGDFSYLNYGTESDSQNLGGQA